MAVSRLSVIGKLRNLNSLWISSRIQSRLFASRSPNFGEDKVVIAGNGSVIVCWHPEETVPYECSRPLPEVEEDTSVLRETGAVKAITKRKTDEQVRSELMKITHTTKHRWFPKSQTRKRYQYHDREYL